MHAVADHLDPLEADGEAFDRNLTAVLAAAAGGADAAVTYTEDAAGEAARPDPAPVGPDREAAGCGSIAAPLQIGDRVLGSVTASRPRAGRFTPADQAALNAAAATAALIIVQRRRILAGAGDQGRAADLEEMKRRILNLAAHELRGPVTVIRGYLEMLGDGSLDTRGVRRVIPILNGKAAQMDALITQMLEVARLEEGRLEVRREIIDLGSVCRKIVEVAGLVAPAGTSIFLERPSTAVMVDGDAERLGTIVANLVDNAVKYSPGGGTVHCRVGTRDGRAFVEVRDQGLGIAADDLPLLFTRFGRLVTPENSHISGMGLGLHLSQELARLHDGEITVQPAAKGTGSVFTLRLPLATGRDR